LIPSVAQAQAGLDKFWEVNSVSFGRDSDESASMSF